MAFLSELKGAVLATSEEFNRSEEVDFGLQHRFNALSEVWGYVTSGKWTKNTTHAHRVVVLLTKTRAEAIKELGLTDDNHARTLLWRANSKFSKMLPKNLIDRILSGDVDSAMVEFRISSGTVLTEKTFLADAFDLLPKSNPDGYYPLSECIDEARFLTAYSHALLLRRREAVDTDKLAYLVHLLNSYNMAVAPDQSALYSVISGTKPIDSLKSFTNPVSDTLTKNNKI